MNIHAIGNAHLDPAWMWTWGEGMEAFAATCRSALDRMDETPEFVFTCSSAAHYRWIEEVDPPLFERIRDRVREGRWAVVGGWWVQADCNLPSGEGFARQALLGQRYFMDRFGVTARTGYSVDAFGHNAGLPQLLARSGMNGYIFCRPDPTELALPSPIIRWESPDGSSVLAYRVPFHYNMYESSVPKKITDITAAYSGPSNLTDDASPLSNTGDTWAIFYGVGNHGGGPTREHIAQLMATSSNPDQPNIIFSHPDKFLSSLTTTPLIWKDALQQNAPGCYSAHSQIKKLNRTSEHALSGAETFSSLASMLLGIEYPAEELRRGWRDVCFNHFHDILCGVAIREACDEAVEQYGEALTIAATARRYALGRIARQIDTTGDGLTLIVFNPHAHDVAGPVRFELWHDIDKALWSLPVHLRIADDGGRELPVQTGFTSGKIGRDRIAATFPAEVPAFGWRCYRVFYGQESSVSQARVDVRDEGDRIIVENQCVLLEISRTTGAIARMTMRDTGRELLKGEASRPVAIVDGTDTWGHGVTGFDTIAGEFGDGRARVVENGPTHCTVRTFSRWRNSWVRQDYRITHDSPNIRVSVKLFWAEQHIMLKLRFDANITEPESVAESAYCCTRNPCDGREYPCGSYVAIVPREAEAGQTGLGIATDAKHGYSAVAGSLYLTILRSPSYATHDPHILDPDEDVDYLDQGIQRFTYVLMPVNDRAVTALSREAALLNQPVTAQFESAHPGILDRWYRGMTVDNARIAVTVIKRGEGNDGWVLRLFNTGDAGESARIALPPAGAAWSTTFAPHEVQTWLVEDGRARMASLTEW